ncbi:unnamed protein product [Rotaria sp. Silwood1]|nr:unnamed protein product [Rotaria sp. Silwood1]CAF1651965.1 unnamed protein product [Rotaria sp. Silwood1]
MDDKVFQHMTRTGTYLLIQELNATDLNSVQRHLSKIVEELTLLLNDLHERQCLTDIQVQQMTVYAIPFESVLVCCLGLTIDISRYISRLLQNIYDQATHSTTFFKASNVIYALENYAKEVHLQSNTLFAAVHVNDLCTLIPHEQLTESLQHFLYDYVPDGQVQGLTVDTIIELVRFVLQNQYFIFDNKICRQIKGCGSGQPLNHLLANIYMFY